MNFLLIGLGGSLGAMTRYGLSQCIEKRHTSFYPLGTFFINLSGALLLGLFSSLSLPSPFTALLCEGFLGAYTTFSTFMREGYTLLDQRTGHGILYILLTLLLGVGGFFLGQALSRLL